jgi:shikimate dehydrogenase
MKGEYENHSVDARGFRALVQRLAHDGLAYVNVTIPHKRAAAQMATRPSRLVRDLGAANTLILRFNAKGGLDVRAENTDGYGLLKALGDLGVHDLRGQKVVMVGAGGAAAGALAALLSRGALVHVMARRPAVASALKRRFPLRIRPRVTVSTWTPRALAAALVDAVAMISAVPASAWSDDDARAGLATLSRRVSVLEMAYGGTTPLALQARGFRAPYQDGLPMLVHQAARAIEVVTGFLPPAAPLLRAAKRS